jgi:hypothetical protein
MAQYTSVYGWLYCIQHPREPNIKIGMTSTSIEKRLRSANTFSTEPFRILHAKFIREPYKVEQAFHQIFEPSRVRSDREFFHPDILANVIAAFKILPGVVHPESEFKGDDIYTFSFRYSGTDEEFWDLFNEHFDETGRMSDRVRLSSIRDTLVSKGLSEDVDIVVELMKQEHFPDASGFYIGIRSKICAAIESFAYVSNESS